jgi:hypothetical protein
MLPGSSGLTHMDGYTWKTHMGLPLGVDSDMLLFSWGGAFFFKDAPWMVSTECSLSLRSMGDSPQDVYQGRRFKIGHVRSPSRVYEMCEYY